MLGYADALRAADELPMSLVVAYDNFVNRLAEGLGVELDPAEVAGYRY